MEVSGQPLVPVALSPVITDDYDDDDNNNNIKKKKKKFCEEVITYFPLIISRPHRKRRLR
jgi:hypothetical protein